jgi:amidase
MHPTRERWRTRDPYVLVTSQILPSALHPTVSRRFVTRPAPTVDVQRILRSESTAGSDPATGGADSEPRSLPAQVVMLSDTPAPLKGETMSAQGNSGAGRISRRRFLRYTAATGVAATTAPSLAAPASAATADRRNGVPVPRFEWAEATIAELQAAMRRGDVTSRQLTQAYISRITEVDFNGPRLNSVLEINPDALTIADELDAERRAGHVRGPLHGIPILLKDNIATDDRMETTAGSLALLGSRPPRDAFVARRLRNAVVVLLGKANLAEWANFRSFQSSSGGTGRAGQCLNPYVLDRNPSGSSSGPAAAIAANLAAVAVGTETDGSITAPASACSVVGLKPTLGLISRSGIIPIAHSQDTSGPMARTVADAATLLGGMTGIDPRDPATAKSEGHRHPDYRRFLDRNGLRGARLGVWREGIFGFSPETDEIIEQAIDQLRALGAEIIDPANFPNVGRLFGPEFTVLLYEFKADIKAYLSELHNTDIRSLLDLIRFNETHAGVEMPWFGQELFQLSQTFGPLTDDAYKRALRRSKRQSQDGIDSVMDTFHLDAIICSVSGPPWTTDLVNGDHFAPISGTTPAAVAGYPHINVPAGYSHHQLPVGLSFFGRAWSEPTLIKLAYAYEQGADVRHPPRFLRSLGVEDFVPRASRPVARSSGVAATTRVEQSRAALSSMPRL